MPKFNYKSSPYCFVFWWILRRELALGFEKIKKILTPKIAFRGLYLYYSASYGRFTDFVILQQGFYVTIFLMYFC